MSSSAIHGIEKPVALITGASQRLGADMARSLHARGMRVVVHYHQSGTAARALCASLDAERPGDTWLVKADLISAGAPMTIIGAVEAHWGRLDVLINNASAFYPTPIAESRTEDWEALFGVNLRAPYFLTQAAMPMLRAQQGLVINLADIYAERPRADYPIYCASKAGLIGLTRALARDLAPDIRVNAIAPGAILLSSETTPTRQAEMLARTPLGRFGDSEDIARAMNYFVDASYVTGQVLTVDGGRTIFD